VGRIVSNFFISLDGVVESPDQWHYEYFNDEMGEIIGAGVATTGAFLMGRVLYGEWSEYWPANTDEEGFGPFINEVQKYVVSNTLTEASWNNTTVDTGDDIADQLRAIKDSTEGDLTMSGSPTTVRWLLSEGLIDELHPLVHPVVVNQGDKLFHEGAPKLPLKLLDSSTLSTGVVNLSYGVA
jgi:dihydrofolate reductase